MYAEIILTFLISAILTLLIQWIIKKSGGNLYTPIRGGTPRAVGIAPFIAMILFIPAPYSYLVAIIGIFAFIDDLIGRKKIKNMKIEVGQLFRGIGMLLVALIGFYYLGPVSILVALMIQPMNIADMQPGTACSSVIIMCILAVILLINSVLYGFVIPLVILAACIGYAPLDYSGKIMMGEIGNHSFAVGLGISYTILGGFYGLYHGIGYIYGSILGVLGLFIVISLIIALLRRENLKIFMQNKLGIKNPYFGDYVMDVMTGGGLGDLIRLILLGKREIIVKNKLLIHLGFRRLLFNPNAN